MKEWCLCSEKLPDDVKDKEVMLSDGSIEIAYLSQGEVWCKGMPMPLLGKDDKRTVIKWRDYGEYETFYKAVGKKLNPNESQSCFREE